MRHDTGPTKAVKELVAERDGWKCLRCGMSIDPWPGYSYQHRVSRGMGGTSDPAVNEPQNLCLLCGSATTGCHGFVESHPDDARRDGYRVDRGRDPANVPVLRHDGAWVFLNRDGSVTVRAGVRSAQFQVPRIPDASDKNPPWHEAVRVRQENERGRSA